MKTKLGLLLIVFLIITGCGSKDKNVSSPKVSFEIKEFNLKYEDNQFSKSYSGQGTIVAVAQPEVAKKPYLVFVKYEKTKGGDATEDKKGIKIVEVFDSIGKISTYDMCSRINEKMEKPEYKFEIVGYIPLIPVSNNSSKNNISFAIKDFNVKYQEELVRRVFKLKSYTGEGTIMVTSSPELANKPYIVMLRLERIKGGRENDTDSRELQYIPIVGGIGKFSTFDSTLSTIFLGKEISPEKFEKPEYKIELLGYKQANV